MYKDLQTTIWDYIIIGTGIGGSTVGYSLASSGKKILYIEKGYSDISIKGKFPEPYLSSFNRLNAKDKELLKRAGRYTDELQDISITNYKQSFIPLLGQGVGGSSLLYGAALERFYPEDFQATTYFSNLKDSSTVDWPISYRDLEPYYKKAEKIFQVYGGCDPLRKESQNHDLQTPHYTPSGQRLAELWNSKNFHPYRLPVGHLPHAFSECPGCQAIVCSSNEKSDAASCCLRPSLAKENVHLIDDCEVLKLVADKLRVNEVIAKKKGELLNFKAKIVVLAAGALNTPALLFKSKSTNHTEGLGNSSGLVGKNLSRHFMDLYMIRMNPLEGVNYYEKELALNDFYFHRGEKYGTLQSLGNPPSVETALYEMYFEYYKSSSFLKKTYYQFVSLFGRPIIKNLFKNNLCLASIMDDVSYYDNCVSLASDEATIQIHYKIRNEGVRRLSEFRKLILNSLTPMSVQLHKQGENNQRLAHASGTCRMGTDSNKSVVDDKNRVHDLENLFIVDSSFFPSGSGINPALTIAANALRVGDFLLKYN